MRSAFISAIGKAPLRGIGSLPTPVLWVVLSLSAVWQSGSVAAQTYTWTGAAGSGNWNSGSNWVTTSGSTAAPPTGTAGAHIVLAGTNQLTGTTSNRTALSTTFAPNAGPFVIRSAAGSRLTLGGPVSNLSGTVQTFDIDTTVSGAIAIDTGSSATGAVVFRRNVLGAGQQLDVVGSGSVVFTGPGSTIGRVTVASGATVSGNGLLPAVTVQAGGVLTATGTTSAYATLTLGTGSTSNGGFIVSGGTSATVAVGISGTTRGSQHDSFLVNGAGNQYGGVLSISFDNATAYAPGTVFNLFQLPNSIPAGNFDGVRVSGGTFDGVTFSGPTNGEWVSTANQIGQTLVFSQLTGDLVVVPEPSTVMIALSGVALVGFGRWRRRSAREGGQAPRDGWMIPLQ